MFVKFVKDDKVVQEVSISPEMIPFPTDTVVLDQQITWTESPQEYNDVMLAYKKQWGHTINLSVEDFFKMKEFVQAGSKLQAVKHVKESAKCGLKEAKDFVDTYCDYVL